MRPPCVLIIEDAPDEAKLLVDALSSRKFPHPVTVVADGVEGLDYLFGRGKFAGPQPISPLLILLDLALPKLDGLEVLEALRDNRWLKYVPVIVFTGSADDQKKLAALDLGAKFVISKPKDLAGYSELADHIHSLLEFIK